MGRYDTIIQNDFTLLDTTNKVKFYRSITTPAIDILADDIYVITVYGDRLDQLAYQYYNDSTAYWAIMATNPTLRRDSVVLEPGTQLRISRNLDYVIEQFMNSNI